jgi:hypothetical protein
VPLRFCGSEEGQRLVAGIRYLIAQTGLAGRGVGGLLDGVVPSLGGGRERRTAGERIRRWSRRDPAGRVQLLELSSMCLAAD